VSSPRRLSPRPKSGGSHRRWERRRSHGGGAIVVEGGRVPPSDLPLEAAAICDEGDGPCGGSMRRGRGATAVAAMGTPELKPKDGNG
jgi:hypothetical protein